MKCIKIIAPEIRRRRNRGNILNVYIYGKLFFKPLNQKHLNSYEKFLNIAQIK
jgi:hypothetical protein